MNITEKIAAIRNEPEHVRLRYVWGCVAISMLLIATIWIFSMAALFKPSNEAANNASGGDINNLKNQLQNIQQQAPSLNNNSAQQQSNVGNEGVNSNQNSADFQYSASDTSNQTPQSPAYAPQQ